MIRFDGPHRAPFEQQPVEVTLAVLCEQAERAETTRLIAALAIGIAAGALLVAMLALCVAAG